MGEIRCRESQRAGYLEFYALQRYIDLNTPYLMLQDETTDLSTAVVPRSGDYLQMNSQGELNYLFIFDEIYFYHYLFIVTVFLIKKIQFYIFFQHLCSLPIIHNKKLCVVYSTGIFWTDPHRFKKRIGVIKRLLYYYDYYSRYTHLRRVWGTGSIIILG